MLITLFLYALLIYVFIKIVTFFGNIFINDVKKVYSKIKNDIESNKTND